MTAPTLPSMIVEDIELHVRPNALTSQHDPFDCDHVWVPPLEEPRRAHCPHCGSFARWVNDPRATEAAVS
jgi:uncharacterized Zn-finger protein